MIKEGAEILTVNPNGVPYFLQSQPYWANWKVEYRDSKGRKVPTDGNIKLHGQYWETEGKPFMEAIKTIPAKGGIGFLLSLRNPMACIDIDNCTKDDPRLKKILSMAPNAWCEYSPSGNGIHVWGRLPDKKSYILPGRKTIGYSGKEYEWFATGRSVTVTGRHICGNRFPDLTQAVLYCESLRPKIPPVVHEVIPLSVPIADTLQRALQLDPKLRDMYQNGHSWNDKSVQDFYFCRKLWFWFGGYGADAIENIFRSSAMFRSHKGAYYPALTIRNAERRWDGVYYGKDRQSK